MFGCSMGIKDSLTFLPFFFVSLSVVSNLGFYVLDNCWRSTHRIYILGSKNEEKGKEKVHLSVRHLPTRNLLEVPYNTSITSLPELSHIVTSNLMGD